MHCHIILIIQLKKNSFQRNKIFDIKKKTAFGSFRLKYRRRLTRSGLLNFPRFPKHFWSRQFIYDLQNLCLLKSYFKKPSQDFFPLVFNMLVYRKKLPDLLLKQKIHEAFDREREIINKLYDLYRQCKNNKSANNNRNK